MAPAGTSNELDAQNEQVHSDFSFKKNTHTHTVLLLANDQPCADQVFDDESLEKQVQFFSNLFWPFPRISTLFW